MQGVKIISFKVNLLLHTGTYQKYREGQFIMFIKKIEGTIATFLNVYAQWKSFTGNILFNVYGIVIFLKACEIVICEGDFNVRQNPNNIFPNNIFQTTI